jgi:hypothetical protein
MSKPFTAANIPQRTHRTPGTAEVSETTQVNLQESFIPISTEDISRVTSTERSIPEYVPVPIFAPIKVAGGSGLAVKQI